MEENENKSSIDLMQIFHAFWRRLWALALCAVIGAGAMFLYTRYTSHTTYTASIKFYVNNSSTEGLVSKLSLSDLSTSSSVVATYKAVLMTNRVMKDVCARAKDPSFATYLEETFYGAGEGSNSEGKKINPIGDYYNYSGIMGMISVSSVDDTPVFSVSVTSRSANDALVIASAVGDVLPDRIGDIIDGTKAKIVDNPEDVSELGSTGIPYARRMMIGFVAGLVVGMLLVFLFDIVLNDTISSDEWIEDTFGEAIPILSVILDTTARKSSRYGYSKYGYRYGYKYYSSYYKSDKDRKNKSGSSSHTSRKENE